jgi:hypothetical protein
MSNSEITITLTPGEVYLASMHGIWRRIYKIDGKRQDREQKERSIWDNEIEGSCAEMAWCKYLGVYWSGVADVKAKDSELAEVRWTRHEDGGLLMYSRDNNERAYILAKGFAPNFRFVGWLYGHEAKALGDQRSFGMLVAQEHLHPMEGE